MNGLQPKLGGHTLRLWAYFRSDESILWLIPGTAALILFAWLLTLVPVESAGRTYAIYGGIYIVASVGWQWAIEGIAPDRWDTLGSSPNLVALLRLGVDTT